MCFHGFDESFGFNYNDVDYCLRLRQLGYRLVMNPQRVELYHHESQRHDGPAAYRPDELVRFQQRWLSVYRDDPFLQHYVFSGGRDVRALSMSPRRGLARLRRSLLLFARYGLNQTWSLTRLGLLVGSRIVRKRIQR